jgi:uncharacterized NAD(P)/FAD-binding protein YdhS
MAIVGAGPKGVGVLERIAANAELLGGRKLVVHLVDPHPPGPGRVWRDRQSALLRMNSMAEDVTMFTDESVRLDGPVVPGPTLAEWMDGVRSGEIPVAVDADIAAELEVSCSTSFATRRLQSAYLNWFFQFTLDRLPSTVEVRVHATRAVDLTDSADGQQQLWLTGQAEPLLVDHVVLAIGHMDTEPADGERDLARFAAAHDLTYLPPDYTADSDFSAIRPGETVLLRGFGLAFVDLTVLLAEGRGGRFTPDPAGGLRYHPSGGEPVMYVGSRRGVPYHAKPEYRLGAEPATLPTFFGRPEIDRLLARPGSISFRADLWPLCAKEIGWGYYTELFTAHPERVRLNFDEFAERYAELDWDSPELRALVAKAVPDEEDRLDLDALDHPLRDRTFASQQDFATYLTDYVEADLARRRDPEFSADLGAFLALLSVFKHLAVVIATGRLDPESQLNEVDSWWHGFFSYFASGPPGHRLEELLALHRAGIVQFIGPDMWLRAENGRFVAGSPAVPGEVTATALIEARLPKPAVTRSPDPLLRALLDRGELAEEVLCDGNRPYPTGRIRSSAHGGNVIDQAGQPHPRRFVLGPHTSRRGPAAFTRPRTGGVGFRENDAVAREILVFQP